MGCFIRGVTTQPPRLHGQLALCGLEYGQKERYVVYLYTAAIGWINLRTKLKLCEVMDRDLQVQDLQAYGLTKLGYMT